MFARALRQADVVIATGWSSARVSKIVQGDTPLTRGSRPTLARVLTCQEADLHQPIGASIPDVTGAVGENETVGISFDVRLRALLRLLEVEQADDLLRFLMAGDFSRLSPRTAQRLREIMGRA